MDKTIEKYLNNVLGQREAHQKIFQFVDSMDNDMAVHFLEEVFDDYFVYRKETRNQGDGNYFYKVPYTIDENGALNVSEDVSKVKKTVVYEAIANTQNKGEDDMATRKEDKSKEKPTTNECPECKAVIDELIANEGTAWTEEKRDFLEEMDLDTLKLFRPIQKEDPKPVDNEHKDEPKPKLVTTQEYVNNAPPEVREVLNAAMATHKQRKTELVKQITSNTRNKFSKEQLAAKPLEELEMLAELAVDANYEGQGGSSTPTNTEKEEPLNLPELTFKK